MAESLEKYHYQKRAQAKHRGIPFHLTLDEMQMLLDEAGITISDIGCKSHEFVLGRDGDEGPYAIGNCHFITAHANNSVPQKYKNRDRTPRPCIAEGTIYPSVRNAAKALGVQQATIRDRCNSPKRKEYRWHNISP